MHDHLRKSIRLKNYDYSKTGLYFVTICVHDRLPLFGRIENQVMVLNNMGALAEECWRSIPNHYPDAFLHEHIIMPNRVHGIIELFTTTKNTFPLPAGRSPSLTLGSIVRGYKIGVMKRFKADNVPFAGRSIWQRNYYEHVIRNQRGYDNIKNYIIDNPTKWAADRFHIV